MKEIKVYASRVVLKCLNCGNEAESETYAGTPLGRPARLFCVACNKPNNHRAVAHIHTIEELGEVDWPPPPPPGVSVNPIIIEAVEVDTEPMEGFPETKDDTKGEEPKEETEGDPEEGDPEEPPEED